MSSENLKNFLIKLDIELMEGKLTQTDALQKYRTSKGDKKAANLTYVPDKITDALKKLGGDVPPNMQTEYDTLVTNLSAQMLKDFLELERNNHGEVVVTEYPGGKVSAFIIKKGKRNNYITLKNAYNATMRTFYDDFLTKIIMKPKGLERVNAKGKTRKYERGKSARLKPEAQTHEDGGSNILNQMNDAVHAAIDATNKASVEMGADVKAELEKLKKEGNLDADFILSVIKNGKMGVIEYGIASSLTNSQTGGGEEQNLRKMLSEAIENLTAFLPTMDGSVSLMTAHRKKIIKELVQPFKNKKGIKVTHEDFNIKENNNPATLVKAAGKTVLAKAAAAKTVAKKNLKKTGKRKAAPPRMALKNILGLLNAKLPQQVADNMGSPRLENRTGKFAQSVRAIDVTETAQGFKSVGYTYATKPYGVYESTSGSRFANGARDPRTLIDLSIREIVAQFGLGRLYTRRL